MCLHLQKDSARIKKNLRRRKGPLIVYKVLERKYNGTLVSPYPAGLNHQWHNFREHRSTRSSTKLAYREIKTREIKKGFHFSRTRARASGAMSFIRATSFPSQEFIIVEMVIDPKDVVAANDFEIVATKAYFAD